MRRGPLAEGLPQGFTLLELMIVVAILGIVATIGVPQYQSGLRIARIGKARHELRTISTAVDTFTANNSGRLPLTLYQVGFGGKRDPWGVPYCYLNYGDGTGDGLEWAVEAGIVDPSAFSSISTGGGGGDGGTGAALPQKLVEPVTTTVNYSSLEERLLRTLTEPERLALEESLKKSGDFSIYTSVETETTRRRDRYMFPINTDYDLFSLGPDHQTSVSLGMRHSLDDVIRANNGGYFGTASDY